MNTPDNRPLLLDLFCCQGGASMGYHQAGFDVIGVDIEPQPRYPFTFHLADALAFVQVHKSWIRDNVTAVAASPPCQAYSRAWKIQQREHPDLIGKTRDVLLDLGLPYVIENVEEARDELRDPVMLCGAMDPFQMRTYRHRLFETGNGFIFAPPEHPAHTAPITKMGRPRKPGEMAHYVGNFSGVAEAREDMGMPWATRDGLREAIPPAYARYIGDAMMAHLRQGVAA